MFVYLIRRELPYECDEVLAIEPDLVEAEKTLRELGPKERTGPRSGLRRRNLGCWEWRIEQWYVGRSTARQPSKFWVSAEVPANLGRIAGYGLEELQ